MISVLSPRRTFVFWSTTNTSPRRSVILPRTRVGACAAAVAAATRSSSARLLRGIDAIFAHGHPAGHELAVVTDACAAEDRGARLEIFARARTERVVLGLGRHQDFLLAVLVLHGE